MKKHLLLAVMIVLSAAAAYGQHQGEVAGYSGPSRDADVIGRDVTSDEQLRANAVNNANARAEEKQRALEEQRAQTLRIQGAQALQAQREAAARAQAQREQEAARLNARNGMLLRESPQPRVQAKGNRTQPGDLVGACGAKGLGVDFATGNCVSPRGGQVNPHNLYPTLYRATTHAKVRMTSPSAAVLWAASQTSQPDSVTEPVSLFSSTD